MNLTEFLERLLRSPLLGAAPHSTVPTPETLRAWASVVHPSQDYQTPDTAHAAELELRALEHALWRLQVYSALVQSRMASLRSGVMRYRKPTRQGALF